MNNVLNRLILPALNRCKYCKVSRAVHREADRRYERDSSRLVHLVWLARLARGTARTWEQSLPLGVPDMVIQRIHRHANVSTTATYHIKAAADDVRSAMSKLEINILAPKILNGHLRDTKRGLTRSARLSKLA